MSFEKKAYVEGYFLGGNTADGGGCEDCEELISWKTNFLVPAEGQKFDCCRLSRPCMRTEIFGELSQGFRRGDCDCGVDAVTEEVAEKATC